MIYHSILSLSTAKCPGRVTVEKGKHSRVTVPVQFGELIGPGMAGSDPECSQF